MGTQRSEDGEERTERGMACALLEPFKSFAFVNKPYMTRNGETDKLSGKNALVVVFVFLMLYLCFCAFT